MSQCSSNPCESRETQKPNVHIFGFDPVSNPVAPVLCQPAQRLVFEISVASSLGTQWHWFLLEFVMASFGKSGVSEIFPDDSGF
jgi:hypothetical protein